MTHREKAKNLIHEFRLLFMEYGEDYGQEILVSVLSKKCALIAVDGILEDINGMVSENGGYLADEYYLEVKQEILNYEF